MELYTIPHQLPLQHNDLITPLATLTDYALFIFFFEYFIYLAASSLSCSMRTLVVAHQI